MRRWITAFVAATVTAATVTGGLIVPAAEAATTTATTTQSPIAFDDITAATQFHREMTWLANRGISTGWVVSGRREYRPLLSVHRDAMAAFLYRLKGSPSFTPPQASPFVDVSPGTQFYKEITWLASTGVSTGWATPAGREFRAVQPVNRDAMAAFLYRYSGSPSTTTPALSPFADVLPSSQFYREITWLAATGVSTGWDVSAGRKEFRPRLSVNRDAMAAFLYRFAAPVLPADAAQPAAGTVTVAPDARAVADGDLAGAAVSLPGPASQGSVVLPSGSQLASSVRPNDVLAAGVTSATPQGMLVRVGTITDDGTTTRLSTSLAALPDAIVTTSGPLQIEGTAVSSAFTPDPGTTAVSFVAPSPARLATAAGASVTASASMSLSRTFRATSSGSGVVTGTGAATVRFDATTSTTAELTLDIGLGKVRQAGVVITPKYGADMRLELEGQLSGQLTFPMGHVESVFYVQAGPIPVVITSDAGLEATVRVGADGSARIRSSTAFSSRFGFTYNSGSFSLIDSRPRLDERDRKPETTASISARLGLAASVDVKLYGIVGVTFGASPYVNASIDYDAADNAWSCTFTIGLDAHAGLTVGIKVYGIELASWSATVGTEWVLFTKDLCAAGGRPSPPSTTLAVDDVAPYPAVVGRAYALPLHATGGTAPYEWSVDAAQLPPGLRIGSGGDWIGGTPTTAGTYPVTVTVRDSLGRSATASASIVVSPAPSTRFTSVASGSKSTCAVTVERTVRCWGWNLFGQLGDGTRTSRSTPAAVPGLSDVASLTAGGESYCALTRSGQVWCWGNNTHDEIGIGGGGLVLLPVQVSGLPAVRAVTANTYAVCALAVSGSAYCWGSNGGGQFGNGSTAGSPTPVRSPNLDGLAGLATATNADDTCGTTPIGTLRCWGPNRYGTQGDGTTTSRLVPADVAGLGSVSSASTSFTQTCAVSMGRAWCWGLNQQGELGDGTRQQRLRPTLVTGLAGLAAVSASVNRSCALGSGRVWCWGENGYGQLGDSTTLSRTRPSSVFGLGDAVSLAQSDDHACVVRRDGRLSCWGGNDAGQLGTGSAGMPSGVPLEVDATQP